MFTPSTFRILMQNLSFQRLAAALIATFFVAFPYRVLAYGALPVSPAICEKNLSEYMVELGDLKITYDEHIFWKNLEVQLITPTGNPLPDETRKTFFRVL